MASILVVEDDDFFRKTIRDLLIKKGHMVGEAPNGSIAREILLLKNYDIVISDIQMPEMNGIDLLKWSVENKPIPFIIMTGFSTMLETQSAYDLGAKEFISKPFKAAELFKLIDRVLGIEDHFVLVEGSSEYCKVSINEFVFSKKLEFDLYVKLSVTKYIKIAYKGEEISKERIGHYKEKGVKYLYVTKDGFTQLVDFNLHVASLLQSNKKISQEKKVNFLKYTGEIILAKAFIVGVDKESFGEAQIFIGLVMNTLCESADFMDLLSMLNNHSEYTYAHSVGVAIYSFMIAEKRGFESNQAFFKLTTAALYHDVGKKEIELELLEKHRSLLSAEEKKMIDSHVVRGQEILLSLKGMPEDVAQLVFEHHEDAAGLGYPMGKNKNLQHPLSRILQLANLFVEQTVAGPHNPGMSGVEAIKYLENQIAGRFDEKSMDALKSLFKTKN